ncbi:hypothetical protein [Planobispora takensis]|uniref:hypothetical protein n=1 Tax=Planobispora takensis TaxID=1367882 RepID=UPI001942E9F4|nr:hypothetical protein [Planobispora takensis]
MIGLAVLDQLVAVHGHGMLHGDVRPGSVLIGPYDKVLLTGPGFRSPVFTAPEGVTGPASDLWSLGATLYAAVEGRPPAPGAPMQSAGPIGPVLIRLLSGDPSLRPDPAALRTTLREIIQESSGPATPAGGFPVPPGGFPPPSSGFPSPPEGFPPSPGGFPSPHESFPPSPGGFAVPAGGFPPPPGAFAAPSAGGSAPFRDPVPQAEPSVVRPFVPTADALAAPDATMPVHADMFSDPILDPIPAPGRDPVHHLAPHSVPDAASRTVVDAIPGLPGDTGRDAAPASDPAVVSAPATVPPTGAETGGTDPGIPVSAEPSPTLSGASPAPASHHPDGPPPHQDLASHADAPPLHPDLPPPHPEDPPSRPVPGGSTAPTERSAGPRGGSGGSGGSKGVLVPRSIVALTCVLLAGMAATIGVLLAPVLSDPDNDEAAPAPGAGALFAAAPRACSLLTDRQAAEVVPGYRSSEVEPAECNWLNSQDWRKANVEKYDLRVRLVAQKQDASGIARAREYLAGKKKDTVDKAALATPRPLPPQDMSGVGEEAFISAAYSPVNLYGGSYKVTVVFRVSNLVAQVDYEQGGVKGDPDGKIAENAGKVSRWIAEALRIGG